MEADTLLPDVKNSATRPSRILVVEDERIVAMSLRRQLQALGYEVVGRVSSGEEAVKRAEELRPSLVLMDIKLEGEMDGVQAAGAIRNRFGIPVVYLTAYSSRDILERAKRTDPFGYVLKPYEDRELLVAVEMALSKHRTEQRLRDSERQPQAELQRQAEDRRIARQIQQGLLPQATPTLPGFRISGRSLSAKDVGGDSFDFMPFMVQGQECLGVLVADASGHGIAAALLVAQTRACLRALAMTCTAVDKLLTLTNRRLTADIVTDHFVSLFLMQLDPRTRSLVYANAGHCPGYVLDRQGEIKAVLASTGTLVGIDPASEFLTGPMITLESGELLFLYSDGIVEAAPPDGKMFGLERTLAIVRGHQQETPDAILDALFEAVNHFSQRHLQDDATAVIIKAE